MIDNYNRLGHTGNQPIRVLQHNIINYFEKTNSVFIEEAKRIIKEKGLQPGIGYYISDEPIITKAGSEINLLVPHVNIDKQIVVQETFLSLMWGISYSLITIFDEFIQKPNLIRIYGFKNDISIDIVKKSFSVFNYATSLINEFSQWDKNSLPNPELYSEKDRWYIEKVNSIFINAVRFILCHEFAHVSLGHIDDLLKTYEADGYYPVPRKMNEYSADSFATDLLLKCIGNENPEIDVKYGLIVGLCSLIFVNHSLTSDTHPDTDERINIALDKSNFDEKDNIWGIAGLAFKLWDMKFNKNLSWPIEADNYKNLFKEITKQLSNKKA